MPGNLCCIDSQLVFATNCEPSPKVAIMEEKALTDNDDITKYVTISGYKDVAPIRHINALTFLGSAYIAIGISGSFQLWNSKGNRLQHHIKLEDVNEFHYFSASAVAKPIDYIDTVFCGDSNGNIYSIIHEKGEFKNELALKMESEHTITCMTSSTEGILAIGDSIGRVSTYKVKSNKSLQLLKVLKQDSFPVNCMITMNVGFNIFVCGYENGMITLISANKQINISAHGRGVTGLAIHSKKAILFSVGEDGCFYTYEITGSTEDKLDIDILACAHVENNLLTGVAYSEEAHSAVAAGYDYNTLYYWKDIC
jgi:WD40 repeat protein